MSSYEWDQNCAVVDRLFYMEYMIRGTTFTALALTLKDLWFIRRNWYADRAYKRLPVVNLSFSNFQYWGLWAALNLASAWFLVYPLTKEEVRKQWLKREALGKFNYSLSMLDLDVDRAEWAEELETQRKVALGLQAFEKRHH